MKDRLEDFVVKNREAFDVHEPDPSLWMNIVNDSGKRKKSRPLRILRYAAAVAVIFAGFSAGIYYLSGMKQSPQKMYGELYKEVVETETYYNSVINQRYSELKPYFSSSPEVKEMLDEDFNELDKIYEELKQDLKDNMASPEVIEAMIQQYRMKVEILEDLLKRLKEKENQYYEDEKISL